ncbi:hypothetical protein BSK63_16945 [Paenibacillus odorifer]|uniref:hypothetical protein n=1 Tax=Paenibacillus odorifer TaxID=189426 RepID=UPI00096C858B|nr:hypothetical protein [Paenibacillus odorifer]OME30582.1 hypothetical protein BSK63_16945 [Paenibacillus odorifer]
MDKELLRLLGLPDDPNVDYVETTEGVEIQEFDIIILGIDREAVLKGHVERYLREFEKFGKKKLRSRIIINFQGWDNDPREVYQIREITNWVERILKNVPHLFYFLSRESYAMRVIFMCLMDVIGRTGNDVAMSKDQAKRLIEKVTKSAVAYSKKSKEPVAEQFALAEGIMEELGYDQAN